ncbi:hypothetical protein DsansV1_C21g0167291 [Dioscorea sansibarensis]
MAGQLRLGVVIHPASAAIPNSCFGIVFDSRSDLSFILEVVVVVVVVIVVAAAAAACQATLLTVTSIWHKLVSAFTIRVTKGNSFLLLSFYVQILPSSLLKHGLYSCVCTCRCDCFSPKTSYVWPRICAFIKVFIPRSGAASKCRLAAVCYFTTTENNSWKLQATFF